VNDDTGLELLFAYGTLQRPEVQSAELGRRLTGVPDSLSGFRLAELAIEDAGEVARNGGPTYPVLRPDAAATGAVAGTLYRLSRDELARADRYEGGDYIRVTVTLDSGTRAWVYVAAHDPSEEWA
jgi:gamma-glutamylcyclotransferase (GGCT)/AIG2-like uncharacterized protein YtfP